MRKGIIAAGSALAGVVAVLLLHPPGAELVVATSDPAGETSLTGDANADSDASTDSDTSTGRIERTHQGDLVSTRWGPVQVSATVSEGTLTAVDLLQLPSGDHHSPQISSVAGARLVEQALSVQSADVDGVSGAPYTSDGVRRSLYSALDEAGL
jgi:uncharacterized protein with FMN-binding domain